MFQTNDLVSDNRTGEVYTVIDVVDDTMLIVRTLSGKEFTIFTAWIDLFERITPNE